MGYDSGKDKGQVHHYRRLRSEPLVPQQSELSGGDNRPHPLWLRRSERRRVEPLYRSGEGSAGGVMEEHRLRS